MQTGRSVQFNHVENVINAYELRAIAAFSIYQGKQLLLKYEGESIEQGAALLNEFLPNLSGSAAIYTLCIYEEFEGRINDKTPYHGSYNFKFIENTPSYNQSSTMLQSVESKINALSEKLDRLEVERELNVDSDSALNGMDRIGAILSHPLIERLIPVVMGFIQPKIDGEPKQLAVMNGIETAKGEISTELREAVIYMLMATNKSEAALIKLGTVAKNNPDKFKSLLSYLNFI